MRAQQPVAFPMGRTAADWILQGGKPKRGPIGASWLYRWHRFWFEKNLRAVDAKSSSVVLKPPVFIMGMWRSGTTFLHELLATNRGLIAPSTWQCMNSSIHLLYPPPPGGLRTTRPMDSFEVSADSPQEDEFAALAQGVPSVYRALFDPRRLPEVRQWLDPLVWEGLPPDQWWLRWCLFLKSVQGDAPGRLLLKSPNHTFRVSAILRQMPQTTLIWILRDPRDVFFSNMKMWAAMVQRYALWEVDRPTWEAQLQEFLAAAMQFSSQALLTAVKQLPPAQLAVLQYDDLINQPEALVRKVHERLELPADQLDREALRRVTDRTASYARTSYDDRLAPPWLEPLGQRLAEDYRQACASHGI